MQSFKRLLVFIIFNVFVIGILYFIFFIPSDLERRIDEFHVDGYTTAIIGQSHAQAGMNPFLFENNDVYNMADGLMTFDDIYALVKLLNENGKLEKIFLDMDSVAWNKTDRNMYKNEGMNGNTNVLFHNTFFKYPDFRYIFNVLRFENYNDVLFRYNIRPSSLMSFPDRLMVRMNKDQYDPHEQFMQPEDIGIYKYEGRGFLYGKEHRIMKPYVTGFSADKVTSNRLYYFNKLVDYCRNNDITIIAFTTALPPARLLTENQDSTHEYFTELCQSYDIPYYDFNYIKAEYLPRTDNDYVDEEGHMMGYLADAETRLFIEILDSDNSDLYFHSNYEDVIAEIRQEKAK